MFESVDARMDGRRLESHPINSTCEPSAQVQHGQHLPFWLVCIDLGGLLSMAAKNT